MSTLKRSALTLATLVGGIAWFLRDKSRLSSRDLSFRHDSLDVDLTNSGDHINFAG